VIRSFRHDGIEKFLLTGSKAGIQPKHAGRLSIQLFALNRAKSEKDLSVPGWEIHPLKGESAGRWSIKVNGNWRLTFAFEEEDVTLLDYEDYH
jgi:proteic killer suppression protein